MVKSSSVATPVQHLTVSKAEDPRLLVTAWPSKQGSIGLNWPGFIDSPSSAQTGCKTTWTHILLIGRNREHIVYWTVIINTRSDYFTTANQTQLWEFRPTYRVLKFIWKLFLNQNLVPDFSASWAFFGKLLQPWRNAVTASDQRKNVSSPDI